jgi:hypothetical protein
LCYAPYFGSILIGPELFKLRLGGGYKLRRVLLVVIKVLEFKAGIKRQSNNLGDRSICFNIVVLSFILCLYNRVLDA